MNAADFDSLTVLEAALAYARLGLKVLPVSRTTKAPLVAHGAYEATGDEETIRSWWKNWPEANLAIALEGLVVVDVDPRNGGPADRDELAERLGRWPDTPEAITGGGGRHLYFRARDGSHPAGHLATGVDVKSGPGAYVVAPPSIHSSGRRYTWDGLADPLEMLRNLPPAPDWVYRRTTGPRDAVPDDAPIPEGQRNDTLLRLGCALRRRGLSAAAIKAALLVENRRRCQPPLPDDEVRRIAESCGRYRPGEMLPAPPKVQGAFIHKPEPVNPDSARSPEEALALLNGLEVWKGRIRWAEFWRVGRTLVGITEDGREARYEVAKLVEFRHIHAQTLAYLEVALAPPKKGYSIIVAGLIGQLMLRAAAANRVETGPPEDDVRALIVRCWYGGGCPTVNDNGGVVRGARKAAALSACPTRWRRTPRCHRIPRRGAGAPADIAGVGLMPHGRWPTSAAAGHPRGAGIAGLATPRARR